MWRVRSRLWKEGFLDVERDFGSPSPIGPIRGWFHPPSSSWSRGPSNHITRVGVPLPPPTRHPRWGANTRGLWDTTPFPLVWGLWGRLTCSGSSRGRSTPTFGISRFLEPFDPRRNWGRVGLVRLFPFIKSFHLVFLPFSFGFVLSFFFDSFYTKNFFLLLWNFSYFYPVLLFPFYILPPPARPFTRSTL